VTLSMPRAHLRRRRLRLVCAFAGVHRRPLRLECVPQASAWVVVLSLEPFGTIEQLLRVVGLEAYAEAIVLRWAEFVNYGTVVSLYILYRQLRTCYCKRMCMCNMCIVHVSYCTQLTSFQCTVPLSMWHKTADWHNASHVPAAYGRVAGPGAGRERESGAGQESSPTHRA
jgi:hypothetical protein